jgi:hypothetical protein
MNLRARPIRLFIALAGGHALLDLGLFVVASSTWVDTDWFMMVALGTSFAQATLLGLYAGLARRPAVERFACVVLGVAIEASWMLRGPGHHEENLAAVAVFALAPLVAAWLVACALRWRGQRIEWFEHRPTKLRASLQFTIFHLFVVTFLMASLSAATRALRSQNSNQSRSFVAIAPFFAALIVIIFITQTLTTIWATLGVGRIRWRLPFLLGWTLATGIVLAFATNSPLHQYPLIVGMSLIQFPLTVGSLLIVRWLGYRLVRPTLGLPADAASSTANAPHSSS